MAAPEPIPRNRPSAKITLSESRAYYQDCCGYLPGGAHYNFADSDKTLIVPFKRGVGSRVWDLDGNEHLDMFCQFGALITGHANQQYNTALSAQLDKLSGVDLCDLEVEVGALLRAAIPCAERVRFSLSGTEAVQNALRLARGYTGKTRFVRFQGHYHGNADNIMGGRLGENMRYPVPEEYEGDFLATAGRAPNVLAQQSFLLPWDDIDVLTRTVNDYKDEIAAIIMEPVCINGGGILPTPGYLEAVKTLCERNNIVLIFDEVITGFRAGIGGAQALLGVTPHLAVFGKALAGGALPVSAIMGHKDIMNLYRTGKVIHGGTFNGYPLGLAAIKANLGLLMEDADAYPRMARHLRAIADLLVKAAHGNGLPMTVQGLPTALVYHSVDRPVDAATGYSLRVKLNDILIREVCKRYGIQFSPLSRMFSTLMMSDDDVRFFGERIHEALREAKRVIDANAERWNVDG